MFDLRKEAEMRLHSEKLAKELALAKQREESEEQTAPENAAAADADPSG
ncbi:hypothetical protein [Streptomyces sp. TRM68367]|nr:hypothetical protein [Streptomyces sp. TRM68367]MBC9729430.1 hypothetical protein [Streptomyces sp. TRM68367]